MIEIKAINIAAIFPANFKPSTAPLLKASTTFVFEFSNLILIFPCVFEVLVSGYIIFAITSAAGADITDAASKCPAMPGIFVSHFTYIASTPPATVANPPTITAMSSDFVMVLINGFINRGASVCPTKTLAATLKVSDPLVPIVFCIEIDKNFIIT